MKVAIIILIVLFFLIRKSKNKTVVTGKALITEKPVTEVPNDKIILIKNLGSTEAKEALKKFCKQYNEEEYAALPRIYMLAEKEHAITFPYDTDFITFGLAVNFLKYPADVTVYGWATTHEDQGVSEPNLVGKVCMFYLADDGEYDNVYLTSSDNFCYKIPFTNYKLKAISPPAELFKNRPAKLADLTNIPYEDIE